MKIYMVSTHREKTDNNDSDRNASVPTVKKYTKVLTFLNLFE